MFGVNEYSEEGRPWFYAGRVAVTSTVLLVGVFTLSMIVVTMLSAFRAESLISALSLDTSALWRGQIWRLVTWPLLNGPSIWFVLSMVMLFFFGREVERLLGRTGLLKFTGLLAAALTMVTVLLPRGQLAGCDQLGFGIFLAFAIIQPGALMMFGLAAKWVALILIGISALGSLANRDGTGLVHLAVLCLASAVILKSMGAAYGLPWLRIPEVKFNRRGQKSFSSSSRASNASNASRTSRTSSGGGPREFVSNEPEVDRLLDKVAAKGLHSLSDQERQVLADASERFKRRR
jgi:membrane associated rhomboid family serine protease